jgi:Putative lumazine-binding
MKTTISVLASLFFVISNLSAQTTMDEEKTVKDVIVKFASAADERNDKILDEVLDNNFRLALNQMFGSKEVTTIDKQTYLSKIREKVFGGDRREVKIENIRLMKNNAIAMVTLKGTKMTIVTFLQMAKSNDGKWKILNDLPSIL